MGRSWEKLAEGEIAIAHLSDLHFGSKDWENVWKLVAQFLVDDAPDLILVPGDLVDSPDSSSYKKAKEQLDNLRVPYFVCAGNHDRHAKGNKVGRLNPLNWFSRSNSSAQFDGVFAGKILLPNKAEELVIGKDPFTWKLGLLGVDSSEDADCSARGYVPPLNFAGISKATQRKDWDLCIFLVHHHLFSIRRLEAKRQNSKRDLLNLTCMVNSGSLLESLSEARADLVLHGHEHEPNWASYSSFTPGCGDVRVIGAGSATGNDSFAGCHLTRASFNIIILSPNRSGRLRRMEYDSNAWKIADEFQLFDAASIRHSSIRREFVDRKSVV